MNESKATRYQRRRRRAQLASAGAGVALLMAVGLTPAAGVLAEGAARAVAGWPLLLQPSVTLIIFVGVLAIAAEVVALPVSLSLARLSARQGRRADDGGSLVSTQVRDACIGASLAFGLAALVRLAQWWAADAWWLALTGLLSMLSLVALRVMGRGLAAAGETQPLARPALRAKLDDLATRACGQPVEVRVWTGAVDGTTAAVTGVGGRGHILLGSQMARDWDDEEIAVVVAHELSHHVRYDLVRRVAVDTVLWTITFWVTDRVVATVAPVFGVSGVQELAALPLIAVVAGTLWMLWRPVRLAQSRAHERQADRFALALTGNADGFARALRRLGEAHLAEERPSTLTRWFFHWHPTVEERVKLSGKPQ